MKIAPCNSWEAQSLSHEGHAYVRLKPLWDVTVPRLIACGLDGKEEGFLLATRLIANSRHMDPKADAHLLPQLQSSLKAVHEAGVVHGDLRPSNIIVEELHGLDAGREQRVWIIDFGHAELDATRKLKDDEMQGLMTLFSSSWAGYR